jgi:hypothetical protein
VPERMDMPESEVGVDWWWARRGSVPVVMGSWRRRMRVAVEGTDRQGEPRWIEEVVSEPPHLELESSLVRAKDPERRVECRSTRKDHGRYTRG